MIQKTFQQWRQRAGQLQTETYAIYLANKDPRVPWYARVFAACIVAYAFSPIDLIPDFIPVFGYLDDLILIPLGIALAIKMIPPDVMAECREKAKLGMSQGKPANWIAASVVVAVWLLLGVICVVFLLRKFGISK